MRGFLIQFYAVRGLENPKCIPQLAAMIPTSSETINLGSFADNRDLNCALWLKN